MRPWHSCAAILVAIALDLLLLWAYRRHRQRAERPPGEPASNYPLLPDWIPRLFDRTLSKAADLWASLCELRRLSRELLAELRSDDLNMLRAFLALGAILVSSSLGYLYADAIMVRGWQLWLWLCCLGVALAAILPWRRPPLEISRRHLPLVGLLVAAALLRVPWLERIPPGLHVDELGVVGFVTRHVYPNDEFTISPFRTGPNFMPTLYYYLPWSSMSLFGWSSAGLRLPSALAGALAVAATYAVVAQMDKGRTAWMAAALMAGYHYHIHWSRIGLNNIWDTLWVPAGLALLIWGWRSRWRGGAALAGLTLGLAQYFYPGNKIALPLVAWLAYWLAKESGEVRRMIAEMARFTATFAVTAGPLILFFFGYPELVFGRFMEILLWRPGFREFPEATGGVLSTAWAQFVRTLGSFTTLTDQTGFYGPGVPLVLGLSAPLLVAGLFWTWRQRQYLPAFWLGLVALLAGFVIGGTPSSSHYVVVIPALSWLIATPLSALYGLGKKRLALALVVLILVIDLGFYFGVYIPGGAHHHLEHSFPTLPGR